jgi:hypothetical protein
LMHRADFPEGRLRAISVIALMRRERLSQNIRQTQDIEPD